MTTGLPVSGGLPRPEARRKSRTVILNQLLFAAVVAVSTALVVLLDPQMRVPALIAAVTIVAVATGLALAIPWHLVPRVLIIAIPALDIVAVGVLREAGPTSGLGFIWAFPAMWIAWSFGMVAALVAGAVIVAIFLLSLAFDAETGVAASTLLLPFTIIALLAVSNVMSRRISAQRALLDEQSRMLERAAQRAHREEDTLREVLDAVDFGVTRYSSDGRVVLRNEAQVRLQCQHERRLYAADGVTPIPSHDSPQERARRGEAFENELVWYGEAGEDRLALSVTARRLGGGHRRGDDADVDGDDGGMIVVSEDVTAEQLALRAREDLISSVSHELRTPLTSIVGYLDLALDDASVSPSVAHSLSVAQRNAERLLDLIADILTASAGSRGADRITIRPAAADLADIVHAALEAAAPRASERGIHVDATALEPVTARIDPLRIRQVVDNLLSNAIKYNRPGGRVEVSCGSGEGAAWIVVRDDGEGISPQELPHLFDRFFRADTVRNTGIHGSGLGLAISRDIARRHGGDIEVQSAPGEGATFVVRLPVAVPAEVL
ncbi:MFS domain-containing histidine kinase [Microbacterium sp. Marseille-Q6965]|uniref:MFS domain-containing histidine kinase n=1 Tax=Microbacterium sp. Marseille-Q6965 TaxID=2965072 RepID=UPI0021B7E7C5|nr:MFS domain-containing histidine kinase [Microbacterium sp. Marseille-Q6965]